MKTSKKYRVIVKVENDKFLKYKVNNLLKFTDFLDNNFPNWRWFNVYQYTENSTGQQIGSFTKFSRPMKMYL